MHASLTEPHPVDPRLERLAGELSSAPMPAGVTLRLWNGFEINLGGEKPACTLQINTPAGLRALLFRPTSLRLGEAYIYNDIDVVIDVGLAQSQRRGPKQKCAQTRGCVDLQGAGRFLAAEINLEPVP